MANDDMNKKADKKKEETAWWQPALVMFAKFSGWIVFPVIVAIFLGQWLDEKYNSKPIFFLGLVGFAFFVSMFGLVKNVKEEYRKIEEEEKNKKEKNNQETIQNTQDKNK